MNMTSRKATTHYWGYRELTAEEMDAVSGGCDCGAGAGDGGGDCGGACGNAPSMPDMTGTPSVPDAAPTVVVTPY